jgi:TolA-binding protein
MYTQEALVETLQDLNTVETAEELAVYKSEIAEVGMDDNEMIVKKIENLEQKFANQHIPTLQEQIAQLQSQIAQLMQSGVVAKVAKQPKVKLQQKWEIVGFDNLNKWTKKAQVFALADIIKSTFGVGAVVTDADIVQVVEEQVGKKLQTTQTGKRIWDYYKGNSNDGFLTHSCIKYANDKEVTHIYDVEQGKVVAKQ